MPSTDFDAIRNNIGKQLEDALARVAELEKLAVVGDAATARFADDADKLNRHESDTFDGTTMTFSGGATFSGAVSLPGSGITGAGAGSGLDADKLDGVQGSGYATSSHTHPFTDVTGTATDAQVPDTHTHAAGSVAMAALATDPLARANHTGTQLHTTISDFDTGVQQNRISDLVGPSTHVDWGGWRLINLGDPTAAGHAMPRSYADSRYYQQTVTLDGIATAADHWSNGNKRINTLADPTAGQHAATKAYADSVSDKDLKENIRDVADVREAFKQLKPKKFDWVDEKLKYTSATQAERIDQLGFIGQEVQALFPEAVKDLDYDTYDEDLNIIGKETLLGLQPVALLAILWKAVQGNYQDIEDILDRLTVLENRGGPP